MGLKMSDLPFILPGIESIGESINLHQLESRSNIFRCAVSRRPFALDESANVLNSVAF